MWDKIKTQLQKLIPKRKCITIGDSLLKDIKDKDYFELIKSNGPIYTLFTFGHWKVSSLEDYESFYNLLEGVENPEMLQFDRIWLQIYKGRGTQFSPLSYSTALRQTSDPMIEEYNKAVSLMKKKGFSLDQVNSFWFVEDLENLEGWEYIRTIIFSCLSDSNEKILIEKWEESKNKSKIEFNRILVMWNKEETDSLLDLLKALNEKRIVIKLLNKHRIKFYNTMKHMDIKDNQHISVYFWNKTHNIFFEIDHKKQRKKSDHVVEISYQRWRLSTYIKDSNNYLAAINLIIFSKPSEMSFRDSESLNLQSNFNLMWFDVKKWSMNDLKIDKQLCANIIPTNFNFFKWKQFKSVMYNTDVTRDWTPSLIMIPSRNWNRNRDLGDESIWFILKPTLHNNLFDLHIRFHWRLDTTQTHTIVDKIGWLFNLRGITITGVFSSQLSILLESQNASMTLRTFKIEMEEPLNFLERFKWLKVINRYHNKNTKIYISEKNNSRKQIVFQKS